MKKFQVVSKQNCPHCKTLKDWLKKENIAYEEWAIESNQTKERLLGDQKFTKTFCDVDGCMVYTPVIRIDKSGEYIYKDLFTHEGLDTKKIKKLIEL
jgi:glutaredoxin